MQTLLTSTSSQSLHSANALSQEMFIAQIQAFTATALGQEICAHLVAYLETCHALSDEEITSEEYAETTQYRFFALTLAQLLGQLPLEAMQPALRSCFPRLRERRLPFTIQPWWSSWYLCSDAEPRLEHALEHDYQGVVLVNQVLLVKVTHGKMAGVALYHTPCSNGFLVPGMWYAPIETDLRAALATTFMQGHAHLTLHTPSTWTLIRPVETEPLLLSWLRAKRQEVHQLGTTQREGTLEERRSLYRSRSEQL